MKHRGKEGCWRFETTYKGVGEKGIYCHCLGDRCNSGSITEADVTPEDVPAQA